MSESDKKNSKKKVIEKAIDMMCDLAEAGTDDDLAGIVRLGDDITSSPLWKKAINGFKERLDKDHPQMHMTRKFMREIDPHVRRTVLKNLICGEAIVGDQVRYKVAEELGFYPPTFMVISPTMACNLSCFGCYAGNYRAKGLDYEHVNEAIQQARDIGIRLIIVSGGEPFYWPPILRMFEDNPDMIFQVYTNGTLIDRALAKRIVELGNVIPCISIEGFEKETDERRGKGVYKKLTKAMEHLQELGAIFSFSVTVHRENVDVVTSDEFIDDLVERGVFYGWYFMMVPIGKGASMDMLLTPEQRGYLRKRIRYFRGSKGVFVADFWNDGDYVDGCIAAGRFYFHINSKGDIEPCVFTHFAKHNIREDTLIDALKSDFFRACREMQPYNKDTRRPCILIDANEKLEEVLNKTGAKPTHDGAEEIVTKLGGLLREWTREYAEWLEEHSDDPDVREKDFKKEYEDSHFEEGTERSTLKHASSE
jgi:MoaA/NifB/PqqE/SkfB family radical SAM enzyme